MCGICGIFNLDGKPVDAGIIRRMNNELAHRGPDGQGVFLKENIGLGHRRLSVIDLATGDQPMVHRERETALVFNGEIYNFRSLREDLIRKGHRFRTASDTEVLLKAYARWGTEAVGRLRGMFAFALWDGKAGKLVLARDRVGKKPLYYYYDGRRLVFASELKAILTVPGIPADLDYKGLDAYFSFGYLPSPGTVFRQVKKLEPARIMVCTGDGTEKHCYWDLNMTEPRTGVSIGDAAGSLAEIFDESVKLRMESDVPLGAFLSGGLDSSAVVASMALFSPEHPVKTCSIGFEEARFNELEYARTVAEQYGTDHHETIVRPDAVDVIKKIAWHFDEPFADASAIPTWYVSKLTREKVTVALSGDGGDENFAGYAARYTMNRLENNIRKKLPVRFRQGPLAWLASVYPRIDRLPRPLRLKTFLTNLSLSAEQAYYRDMSFYFRPEEKAHLYSEAMKERVGASSSYDVLRPFFHRNRNPDTVTRAQYVDIKTYMTEDILVKVDRMSMAHSLEVRSPLLDHHLMEFAATLPSEFKLNKEETKYIFKEMNRNRLPSDILYRPKQGFNVPLSAWFRGELKSLVMELLFSGASGLDEFFNMKTVRQMWEKHLAGVSDFGPQIWNIVMFAVWRDLFLERKSHVQ
ncbi:MAG: asparagine synthase (glutamine-hydrolyzing) [Desulfobacterales bacterium]|nr:asparagine synthase (glutamine-hydrolyzing) [Desulfobacterales bacterium]